MKKKVLKLCTLVISLTLVMGLFINVSSQNQVDAKDEISTGPEITDYFTVINEDGSSSIVDFEDIENDDSEIIEEMTEYNLVADNGYNKEVIATYETEEEALAAQRNRLRLRSVTTYSVEETTKAIEYGVVYLKSTSYNGQSYLTYDNVLTGYDGYTTGSYAKDAAYIGTYNGKVRAKQAGTVMDFDARDVTIVDYENANISYYYVEGDYLYHKYYYGSSSSSFQRVGKKPSYLSTGKKYYSYDGHYFYTSYPTMIKDYQNSNTSFPNAVNKSNPFYNYYQFLSHRSKTTLSASNLNTIVKDKTDSSSTSKMNSMGQYYIENQNTYGTNALLMFGVSGNESYWGRSKIAQDKNNLFGHGAVDSNPYYGANGYANPQTSIKYHAEKFISNGYLDNEDWRYNGGHLGDKLSGINVRYASDPYWGEKAASVNYYYNYGNDYNKYTIGIINGQQKGYKLYKEASTATVTHTLGKGNSPRTYNLPVIILDTVTVSGKKWYKIQSDTALNASRTDTDWDNEYKFSRDYLYIPAADVTIVSTGYDSSTSDGSSQNYLIGDVNGDGKIDSMDMYQLIQHILGEKTLTGNNYLAADTNSDGKIDSMDMYNVIQIILKK